MNWFEDTPPQITLERELPRFPFPTAKEIEEAKIRLPSWFTMDVWRDAANIFALPPVSPNYPDNNKERVYHVNRKDFQGIPLILPDEKVCSFSAEYSARGIQDGKEKRIKRRFESVPCVVFSFDNGPRFRIPAAHHQLFVLWLLERGREFDMKDTVFLDWETVKNHPAVINTEKYLIIEICFRFFSVSFHVLKKSSMLVRS